MTFTYSFGPNRIYGIELSLLKTDIVDFEILDFEWISFKMLIKFFGIWLYLLGLDISKDRTSIGLLNCFLAVFYG